MTAHLLAFVARDGVRGRQAHDANIVAIMLARGIGRLLILNEVDFRRFEPGTVNEPG